MDASERFWAKVDKSGECWEWTGGLGGGIYGNFWLNGKTVGAHRLSYILHHPLTIDLWEHREILVCHTCDNPKCINPAHLFLGSGVDNMKDMVAKGRSCLGIKNQKVKLIEQQVRGIRKKYANGSITRLQLALEYEVSVSAITDIILRRTWKHLD